jgi:hypothetical protein
MIKPRQPGVTSRKCLLLTGVGLRRPLARNAGSALRENTGEVPARTDATVTLTPTGGALPFRVHAR